MIKIIQVQRSTGDVYLTFQYNLGGQIKTIVVDTREIIERMKSLKVLVGRPLTLTDLKNIVITMINEIRVGKQPLLETFSYENYINIDLET